MFIYYKEEVALHEPDISVIHAIPMSFSRKALPQHEKSPDQNVKLLLVYDVDDLRSISAP